MELLTFFLGVIVAVAGYIMSNFLLKPIQDYKKIIGKVGYKLTYYVHIITSPQSGDLADEASLVLRDLACDLERKYCLIILLPIFNKLGIVPNQAQLIDAKKKIIFLSNSVFDGESSKENRNALDDIFTSLKIKELEKRHNLNDK